MLEVSFSLLGKLVDEIKKTSLQPSTLNRPKITDKGVRGLRQGIKDIPALLACG